MKAILLRFIQQLPGLDVTLWNIQHQVMILRKIVLIQALYYFITGIWPLLDINSFMAVTGPKTDLWLVKMVGLLSMAIGATLAYNYASLKDKFLGGILGIGGALSFAIIGFTYASNDVISNIYIVDGVVQLMFIIGWIVYWFRE